MTEVDGVPGDANADCYFDDGRADTKAYFDVTVGNIFADSYLKQASNHKLYLANLLEKRKHKKYKTIPMSYLWRWSVWAEWEWR